jgi:asparagine synthetase B (glutamine-hydrolysing)
MPGIVGLTKPDSHSELTLMKGALFSTPFLHYQKCDQIRESWGVIGHKQDSASCLHRNVKIAFEGYITNTTEIGKDLLCWLISLFLDKGECFAKDLHGSFQMVIKHKGKTYLYVDHTGSRPLFFMIKIGELYFSPEIAPLIKLVEKVDLDEANLVQFLVTGHFFSGCTMIRQIKRGKIELKKYYRYQICPEENFDENETVHYLNSTLEKCIIDQWKCAEAPGIFLSGGIDSRYIFYTIAEHVSDTTKLRTVTWGQDFHKKCGDIAVSNEIAKRFDTQHILLHKDTKNFKSAFHDMFYAQSGMTDSAFIHADELEIGQKLRELHGIKSCFRGDQVFSTSGHQRTRIQNALLSLGLSLTNHIYNRNKWFTRDGEAFFLAHSRKMEEFVSSWNGHPNDLKDTVRFNERLPMYLHYLNYYKFHYQEVFNPLLDPSILAIANKIPSAYRSNKRLFKKCYTQRFRDHIDVPFATRDNMINWDREIYSSKELQSFLKDCVDSLPDFFNKQYFNLLLGSIRYSSSKSMITAIRDKMKRTVKSLPLPDQVMDRLRGSELEIAPSLLILRLVTISKWFRLWIR